MQLFTSLLLNKFHVEKERYFTSLDAKKIVVFTSGLNIASFMCPQLEIFFHILALFPPKNIALYWEVNVHIFQVTVYVRCSKYSSWCPFKYSIGMYRDEDIVFLYFVLVWKSVGGLKHTSLEQFNELA